jgi:hypothetical protein
MSISASWASGDNYRIDLVRTIAWVKVWKRPDLTRERGATLAREKVTLLRKLADGPRSMAKALLLDLREAPTSWGPMTQAALAEILSAWEHAGRRIAILLSQDPVQGVLVRPLIKQAAPNQARTYLAEAEALDYSVHGQPSAPPRND